MLRVVNTNTGTSARGLSIYTAAGKPPIVVENPNSGKATNLNADKVDGLDSSQLKASCPAGTQSLGGACIESSMRGTARLSSASSTCAGIGRRLPTSAELDAFRQQPNVTIGSNASEIPGAEWSGAIVVDQSSGAIAMTDAGAYYPADKNVSLTFRCVVSPS